VQTVHPNGQNGNLFFSNQYEHTMTKTAFLPRFAFTYTANPDTVIRGSYGRYVQLPETYGIQYDAKEPNLAATLFQSYWQYGFTTPRHEAFNQYSNNADISYERHFPGSDVSLKLTPYLRDATNQLYQSGPGELNIGTERTSGVELMLTKGDFSRNGWSGQLAYTYLDSHTRYGDYPGSRPARNPVDAFNDSIKEFNALTQAGGGAPCYMHATRTAVGAPDPLCGSSSIRNPYYNTPAQPLLDRNGWYKTGLDSPYLVPHVLTGILSYRRNRLTVTPSFSFNAGTFYGSPTAVQGIDPRNCRQNSAGLSGSPIARTNPLQADYTSCGYAATASGTLYIPNPETGSFDTFGKYQQPSQLNVHVSLGYDLSDRTRVNLILANVLNRCFGGSSTPWRSGYPPSSAVCAYQANGQFVSNFYNGVSPNDIGANGVPLNPFFAHAYSPSYADPSSLVINQPFNAYLQFQTRL
jgi:hypothetical protein